MLCRVELVELEFNWNLVTLNFQVLSIISILKVQKVPRFVIVLLLIFVLCTPDPTSSHSSDSLSGFQLCLLFH